MSDLSQRTFTNADQEVVPYDGSPVEWRVSVYVIVIKDRKILLGKSKVEKLYDIPGGGVDIGETLEEAIAREALEEVGAQIKLGEIVLANLDYFYHRKGKFYQALQLFYIAELVGELGEPTDELVESVEFVSLDQIEKYPLPPIVLKALERVRR
jgi:8-oxo-dGTP pyrophosphatase MutT (NUDIX family)